MWTYDIQTGTIAHNGLRIGTGYSGFGEARNDVSAVRDKGAGPIPPGRYHIGPEYTHAHLGPITMNLDPYPENEMFGRSLFRIHGDNAGHDASHGCIVLPPACRRAIAASADRVLEVQ